MNTISKAAIALSILAPFSAHAQNGTCRDKVIPYGIGAVASVGGQYDYTFRARSIGTHYLNAVVTFKNFPSTVRLNSPSYPLRITSVAGAVIRFGRGTEPNISSNTVQVVFDNEMPRANMPYIHVSHCVLQ